MWWYCVLCCVVWCGGGIAKICVSFSMVVWCGVEFYIMWYSVVWCCANGGVFVVWFK